MVSIAQVVLVLMRLVLFGLALGLTVISFQAYSKRRSQRLQYAFIGFAFVSMGVAVSNLTTQLSATGTTGSTQLVYFQIAQTVPFIIGFSMIYVSLYR